MSLPCPEAIFNDGGCSSSTLLQHIISLFVSLIHNSRLALLWPSSPRSGMADHSHPCGTCSLLSWIPNKDHWASAGRGAHHVHTGTLPAPCSSPSFLSLEAPKITNSLTQKCPHQFSLPRSAAPCLLPGFLLSRPWYRVETRLYTPLFTELRQHWLGARVGWFGRNSWFVRLAGFCLFF